MQANRVLLRYHGNERASEVVLASLAATEYIEAEVLRCGGRTMNSLCHFCQGGGTGRVERRNFGAAVFVSVCLLFTPKLLLAWSTPTHGALWGQ